MPLLEKMSASIGGSAKNRYYNNHVPGVCTHIKKKPVTLSAVAVLRKAGEGT